MSNGIQKHVQLYRKAVSWSVSSHWKGKQKVIKELPRVRSLTFRLFMSVCPWADSIANHPALGFRKGFDPWMWKTSVCSLTCILSRPRKRVPLFSGDRRGMDHGAGSWRGSPAFHPERGDVLTLRRDVRGGLVNFSETMSDMSFSKDRKRIKPNHRTWGPNWSKSLEQASEPQVDLPY